MNIGFRQFRPEREARLVGFGLEVQGDDSRINKLTMEAEAIQKREAPDFIKAIKEALQGSDLNAIARTSRDKAVARADANTGRLRSSVDQTQDMATRLRKNAQIDATMNAITGVTSAGLLPEAHTQVNTQQASSEVRTDAVQSRTVAQADAKRAAESATGISEQAGGQFQA